MKEPLSTVSNAFYGAAAMGIVWYGPEHSASFSYVYVALSAFLLMVGSGLYHATHEKDYQAMDEVAMYVVAGSLMGAALHPVSWILGVFVWLLISVAAVATWKTVDSFVVVPSFAIALGVMVSLIAGLDKGLILLTVFICSAALRQLGEKKYRGRIGEEILHSLWHLGTATAIFLCYFYLNQ